MAYVRPEIGGRKKPRIWDTNNNTVEMVPDDKVLNYDNCKTKKLV